MVEDSNSQEFDVLVNDTPSKTGETLTVTAATATNGVAGVTADFKKITYRPNPISQERNWSDTPCVAAWVE